MNRKLLAPLSVAILTISNSSHAAEKEVTLFNGWLRQQYPGSQPWDIGAELRGRFENKDDAGVNASTDFVPGIAESREAFYFREKIHVGYKSEWIGGFVEGRDASGHEDEKADDVFDLHQAYLTLGNAKEFPLTAQIGRQELSYGDQRFVGKGDWSNYGRSFDAVKLRLENPFGWVDAFTSRVVLPDDGNFNTSNDYDYFSGIYAGSKKLMPWQDTQVYFLARNYGKQAPNAIGTGNPGSPSTQRDIYTLGTLWKSNADAFGGWDYSLEAAFQFGSVYNSAQDARLDQRSHALFLDGGHTWDNIWSTPRLGIGYEYGSGDGDSTDGRVETLENLFGTQHRPYGLMDLAGARNMHIPKLAFSMKPVKGLTFSVDYLTFILADTGDLFYPESGGGRNANGYGINSGYGSYVGSEIDIYANYAVTKWSNVQLGYGHFFTGDYIEDSVGTAAEDADWFYTQLTLTF
ncbi:alginate export family protein [Luteolibacter yonseiensis]|uniref:Alginate export family protein n=1 Tax=Luteolibacter yonseiensis TaxID=1144680 RepID=A0A934RAK8_9BACT|nr:alginate export family protein [Luteolibacter yonseiensis]MBK1818200.1 alginate export family protein [Luteolibacter yonseiensis]